MNNYNNLSWDNINAMLDKTAQSIDKTAQDIAEALQLSKETDQN